eukprot:COSAG01_NODE_663_length_14420_cov_77.011382_12_plen_137_part_00
MRRLLLLPHGGWRPALCLDCAYVAAVLVDRKLRGGGCRVLWQDVEALGAQMQHTWLTFARTGTPPPAPPRSSAAEGGGCAGGGGGDVWRSYDEQTRPTMVFDGGSRSRLVSDPMAIERQSVDAAIGAARHGATLGL